MCVCEREREREMGGGGGEEIIQIRFCVCIENDICFAAQPCVFV